MHPKHFTPGEMEPRKDDDLLSYCDSLQALDKPSVRVHPHFRGTFFSLQGSILNEFYW